MLYVLGSCIAASAEGAACLAVGENLLHKALDLVHRDSKAHSTAGAPPYIRAWAEQWGQQCTLLLPGQTLA